MKMHKINLALFMLLGISTVAMAQDPMSLYFLETIPQSINMNPAQQPRANAYISLPSVGVNFNSSIAVGDILQKQDGGWYLPVEKNFDYGKLRKSIGKKGAAISLNGSFDIIGFGFRASRGYVNVTLTEHFTSQFTLPTDLFKITENGFPDGQNIDLSPLRVKAMAYKQILIGYSLQFNDKWSFGVNVKPLFGQVAMASSIDKLNIKTSLDKWEVGAKGSIQSSAPIDLETDEKGNVSSVKSTFEEQDLADAVKLTQKYITSFTNPGIAFDLGASYNINRFFQVSAALTNLGFISWNDDLHGVEFNGNYTYNVDSAKYDAVAKDNPWGKIGDQLADAVDSKPYNEKFRTTLAPSLYLAGKYKIITGITAGLVSRTIFRKNAVRQQFNLSAYLQPYSFVSFSAGLNYQVKGNIYLGTGVQFLLGPLQIYAVADLPMRYSNLHLYNGNEDIYDAPMLMKQKDFTFKLGLNIIFGRHGYQNMPMFDRSKSTWQ